MRGMAAAGGKVLSDEAHISQSVMDILMTPLNSRVMRRDYGSRLPLLMDRPITQENAVEVYAAVAEALGRWEPRIQVQRIQLVSGNQAGGAVFEIAAINLETGKPWNLTFSQEQIAR